MSCAHFICAKAHDNAKPVSRVSVKFERVFSADNIKGGYPTSGSGVHLENRPSGNTMPIIVRRMACTPYLFVEVSCYFLQQHVLLLMGLGKP